MKCGEQPGRNPDVAGGLGEAEWSQSGCAGREGKPSPDSNAQSGAGCSSPNPDMLGRGSSLALITKLVCGWSGVTSVQMCGGGREQPSPIWTLGGGPSPDPATPQWPVQDWTPPHRASALPSCQFFSDLWGSLQAGCHGSMAQIWSTGKRLSTRDLEVAMPILCYGYCMLLNFADYHMGQKGFFPPPIVTNLDGWGCSAGLFFTFLQGLGC